MGPDPATWAYAAAFILGTVTLTWAVYFTVRAAASRRIEQESKDLAGSVMFRVSALHGLILALVFAQELYDYTEIRTALVREATAIADIFNDIRRYGADTTPEVQKALADYTTHVIEVEWDLLGAEARLSPEAWVLRETVYQKVLDLEPDTARHQSLRDHMLFKIQQIAELRQDRENTASHDMSVLFWIAAFAGIVLVTVPYFVFAPTALHLALLSVYGGFSGLIMFIIFAFSDPFSPPGALRPVAFEKLMQTEIGRVAASEPAAVND